MKTIYLITNSSGYYWISGMNFTEDVFKATHFETEEGAIKVVKHLINVEFANFDIPLFFQTGKYFTNK